MHSADAATADAVLVRRARAGSEAAFEHLVRRHQRGVQAVAASLLRETVEAEDMAQEAFLRAFRNLDMLADPARFGPWVRRVAFGVCVDALRARRPELHDRLSDDAGAPDHASSEISPLERVERLELAERVLDALHRLPERYRVPLTMYHLDGLSHARVADALGVAPGTVRSLVSRARDRMRGMLATYAAEALPHMTTARSEDPAAIDDALDTLVEQPDPPRRFLHVTNGDVAAEGLRRSIVPGATTVWAEVLHDGPVSGETGTAPWREMRARFLAEARIASYEQVIATLERWDASLESFADHDEVVLWFEHDLFDQLLLVRHLYWFSRRSLGATTLSLICIGEFEGVEPFHGLGQLTPHQLASLLGTRQRVTPEQLALGTRAWKAFASDDPMRLQELVDALRDGSADAEALPFLEGALTRHLEDFPSVENGLARTERHILDLLAERGALRAVELFRAEQPLEERVFMGDTTFWRRLHALAIGPAPLVAVDGNDLLEAEIPTCTISLTAAGARVRAGEDDRLRLGGVDRWMGGVRLTAPAGGDVAWRWSMRDGRLQRR